MTARPQLRAHRRFRDHAERDAYLHTFVADYNRTRLRCLGYQAPAQLLANLAGHNTKAGDILAAGEGVETMLALKSMLPPLPVIAGLSANHLAALDLPPAPALRRLYIACDNDAAGFRAAQRLRERGIAAGIETRGLVPVYDDFNLDLCRLGPQGMRAHLADQLVPSDREHFLPNTRRSDPRR